MKTISSVVKKTNLKRRRTLIYLSMCSIGAITPITFGLAAKITKKISGTLITFNQFVGLSKLLLNKRMVNEQIAERLFIALSEIDIQFISNATNLLTAIEQNDVQNVEALKNMDFYCDQENFQKVVMAIVGGWYLGYVGTPEITEADDNARFISFTEALMYVPTRDISVIPSYAKWRTNYWEDPPLLSPRKEV